MPIACRPTTSLWCVTFCRRIWWRPSFPGGSTVNCTPCWCRSLPALQTGNNPTYGKSPMSSRLASKRHGISPKMDRKSTCMTWGHPRIKEAVLTEGLVRDLWSGEWRKSFEDPARAWHRRSKELIKKLASQGRLIPFPAGLRNPPVCDQDWCADALKSHEVQAIAGGIIVTETVKDAFAREPLVARIDRLGSAPWWRAARSPSVRLSRTLADYTKHLEPVLRCSNSLLFIDPHLDPMQERYDDIGELIAVAGRRHPYTQRARFTIP